MTTTLMLMLVAVGVGYALARMRDDIQPLDDALADSPEIDRKLWVRTFWQAGLGVVDPGMLDQMEERGLGRHNPTDVATILVLGEAWQEHNRAQQRKAAEGQWIGITKPA